MTQETREPLPYKIRKWFIQMDETHENETGVAADGEPVIKLVVAAVIANPYAGRFSEDLSEIVANSDKLGAEFGRRIKAVLGDAAVQSYGKACVVGSAGEYEHGNAFLTQFAADPVRRAIGGGKAWVPSTGKVGAVGATIDIPLAHKDALYVRSHYDTITATFPDAPRANEVVIAWAVATRGRLHARLGGLKAEEIAGENGLN